MNAKSLFAELRRRKVIHTALVYAAFAWLAIEVVTTLLPVFGGRDTVVRLMVVVILLGLPVAVVVSWLFDWTPSGFQRDEGARAPADPGDNRAAGRAAEVISRPPPAPATPLIGREKEVAEVVEALRSDARALTVTGPGGTGKTRLAIAAADTLRDAFPDGVAYVELAAITDPGAVLPTIATAVGVKDAESRSLAAGIATVIGDRRVLLVLDNLEQVIAAAPELAGLLRECPALRLLSTSRAPLRIAAEVEFPLRPLGLPPPGGVPPLEDLETYAAIELFIDRTRRARPNFHLTSENAAAVVGICRRLDGLPLALELAAARLRTLDPATLLGRLEHALDVLTAGARDLPERQRTLRATIDWSHSLLEESEQRLFRRLAVFAGGWTLPAIAPVCYGEESDRSLDATESLVEKGLVQSLDDAGRFTMLETIREYAVEQLAGSGEQATVQRRHAQHFHAVAEQMYTDLRHMAQVASLATGDTEAANIEAALAHLHEAATAGDAEAAERGLLMCGDLWMYWHVRGRHIGAREWCQRFLDLPAARSTPLARARALETAAVATMTLGDVAGSVAMSEEAEALTQGMDTDARALIAMGLGVAHLTAGDLGPARHWFDESVQRGRGTGATWEYALALSFLGLLETAIGNVEAARALFNEALPLQRAMGDHEGMGASIGGLAACEAAVGNHERALEMYRESFDAYHTIGDRPEEARILDASAWTALAAGRPGQARDAFAESLRAYEEVGSVRGIGLALLGLAATETAEHNPRRALRIAAAAATFSEQEGVANDYAKDTSAPRYLDSARAGLDPATLERLEAEGRAMTVREAVRYALNRTGDQAVAVR